MASKTFFELYNDAPSTLQSGAVKKILPRILGKEFIKGSYIHVKKKCNTEEHK